MDNQRLKKRCQTRDQTITFLADRAAAASEEIRDCVKRRFGFVPRVLERDIQRFTSILATLDMSEKLVEQEQGVYLGEGEGVFPKNNLIARAVNSLGVEKAQNLFASLGKLTRPHTPNDSQLWIYECIQ